jgi:hypothetical protein
MIASALIAALTAPAWLIAAGLAALAVGSVVLRRWARHG